MGRRGLSSSLLGLGSQDVGSTKEEEAMVVGQYQDVPVVEGGGEDGGGRNADSF